MTAITIDERLDQARRRSQVKWLAGLVLSMILHGMVLGVLAWPPARQTPAEPMVVVDLVNPTPPAPPPPPKPPEPPPEEAPAHAAQAASAAAPSKPMAPPPPKPHLAEARTAEKSAPVEPTRKLEPSPAQRNVSDLILSAIAGRWSPPPELRGVNAWIHLSIDIKANGMFGPPFERDAPWNPAAALIGFDDLPVQDPKRLALASFYRALRDIQPIRLPPELAAKAPMNVPVAFLFDDMP